MPRRRKEILNGPYLVLQYAIPLSKCVKLQKVIYISDICMTYQAIITIDSQSPVVTQFPEFVKTDEIEGKKLSKVLW